MPPALLLTVETTKTMKTFAAKFVRDIHDGSYTRVAIVEKDSDGAVLRIHDRPAYTRSEARATAQWLSERARGYPRNGRLDNLYNGREFASRG